MISDDFYIASGTSTGFQHWRMHKNNQDAHEIASNSEGISAFICDGCSAGAQSEMGAIMCARFLSQKAAEMLVENSNRRYIDLKSAAGRRIFSENLRQNLLAFMRSTLMMMGGEAEGTIRDTMLFTCVGLIATRDTCFVIMIGDGFAELNGKIYNIQQNNMPCYVGYELLENKHKLNLPFSLEFAEVLCVDTKDVKTLKIGSDGAATLQDTKDEMLKDGCLSGCVLQFNDDRYYLMKNAIKKRLTVIGILNKKLPDDTTIVALKRKDIRNE